MLRDYTTIRVPATEDERLQVGFGTNDWTLTEAGRQWKQKQPSITSSQMMQNEGFAQDRVPILWTPWSIYAAAAAMFVLYLITFLLWTAGFALMAKQKPSTTN